MANIYFSMVLLVALAIGNSSQFASGQNKDEETLVLGALQAAQAEPQQEESYQRVYEAFTKLMQNVSNNSLGNARRLVSRLNQLVGGQTTAPGSQEQKPAKEINREQNVDEKTEQILNRLDNVNKDTDQHTLRQLNEDVNRLVGTLSESYLRNIRRVIERVNKTLGSTSTSGSSSGVLHQSGDRLEDNQFNKTPGFPGWDEFIVAVDRMQKSLANFVRSSTRLVTSG